MERSRPSDVATVDEPGPPPSSAGPDAISGELPRVTTSGSDHADTRARVLEAMFGDAGEAGPRDGPGGLEPARYERIRSLGRGAMGRVDLARDLQLDRLVALKTIAPERARDSRARARIEQEARALAQIDHPNVVSIYDVFEVDGTLTLTMEFVEGQTLRKWLQEDPPLTARLERIMAIAAGLQAAHDQGIVHRDVKPDNVIVTPDGGLKVVDFGLARSADSQAPTRGELERTLSERSRSGGGSRDSVSLTRTGAMVGTPAYMAPEQFMAGTVDARSDQFALGVILFEALTGERPFAGRSAQTIATNIIGGRIDPLRMDRVPRWLQPVIKRALDAAPDERFPSLAALGEAIDPHRRRRRRQLAFALPLGGAALAGVVAVGLHQPAAAPPDPCAHAGREVLPTWTPEMDSSMRAHFEQRAPDFGAQMADTAARRIAGWQTEWADTKSRACRDTHHDQSMSMESFERSSRCLEQALLDFESIAAALVELEAPGDTTRVLEGLPPIAHCRDPEALAAAWARPADPSLDRSVRVARAGLSKVRAMQLAGRYQPALDGTAAVREMVPAGSFLPLDAELALARGEALLELGESKPAERALLEATHAAEASRHDELSVKAWRRLVGLAAVTEVDAERARFYFQRADAAVLRLGDPQAQRLALRQEQAQVEIADGQYETAEGILEALLADLAAQAEATDRREALLASVEMDLGRIEFRRQNITRAHELFSRAEIRLSALYGATHPETLDARHNRGTMLIADGKIREGLAVLEETLAGRISTFGEDHEAVARTLNSIASAHYGQNDFAIALSFYERATAIHLRVHAGEHVLLADTLANSARCLARLDRFDEADERFAEAARILESKLGPEHPRLAETLGGWASAMVKAERFEEALALHERVIAMRRKALGPVAPRTLIGEYNAAEVERGLGHRASAKARLARIIDAPNKWPAVRVHALVLRGWIETDEGKPAAARKSFEQAIAEQASAGEDANLAQAIDEAKAWLAKH